MYFHHFIIHKILQSAPRTCVLLRPLGTPTTWNTLSSIHAADGNICRAHRPVSVHAHRPEAVRVHAQEAKRPGHVFRT